jgi:hypothetical protein
MTPPRYSKYESRKKNNADAVKDCIKSQNGERHFKACYSCQLNCMVVRKVQDNHWANSEGIKPIYQGIEDCPKAENIDKSIKAKAMKRFRGKR